MNKFEREVARSQLKSEREALEQLKELYKKAVQDVCEKLEISNGKISILLNEIENADEKTLSVLQSQIYQRNFQQNIKKQLDFLLQDLNDNQYTGISEYLENCYNNGFIGTLYNFNMNDIPLNIPIDPTLVVRAIYIDSKLSKKLYDRLGEDVEQLKKKVSATISRGIASNMHYSDIARNIANNSNTGLNNAMRIVRTEGNRIYNAANLDCGKAAKEKGVDDVKQWDSTLDGNTRPHHRQLDGQVRELEEDFEVAGRKAPAPLQFGRPEEDINCRCICLVKPRWDVDSAFTKIDNQTGQLLEFEGTKDYEEFKKRYWESVDKSQKSGIMRVGSDDMALENQRYGRNKDTLVNKTYIESGEYKRKFDNATDNPNVNKTLYDCAKAALKHRSGTVYEDMYWIDDVSGKIVTEEITGEFERRVKYTSKTKKIVNSYERNKLVALHTHPSSMPPSAGDFNACYRHGYKCGFIACHDGKVFCYIANEEINVQLYNMYIENYVKKHISEFEAQILALNDIKRNCNIDFWEVK